MIHRYLQRAAAGLLLAACANAFAHDSWFEAQPLPGAAWRLSLGTGDRFPLMEFPLAAEYLTLQGCRDAAGAVRPMAVADVTAHAHGLRTPAAEGAPLSCFVQSQAFEVALAPDKIERYLKEIQAGPALRADWAAMQARGLAWHERYSKHARIELPGADGRLATASPAGLALEAVMAHDGRAPQRGQALAFTLLRDGQPLAGLPVEFVNERSRIGLWRRSDAQGRVEIALPWAGRWLLRGTDLRLSTTLRDTWDSRFVTLAFELGDAAPAAAGVKVGQRRPSTLTPALSHEWERE